MNRKDEAMIEVKAKNCIKDGDEGVSITTHLEGSGKDLIAEAVSIIESLMRGLKRQAPGLHILAMKVIAENPWILTGEGCDEECDAEAEMANAMSKGILKGGVN